ncbi:MAG TPA: TRAM domain-containing protein [Candidatus Nanoarchaeia archaeon]|nr:TRAM domain-containing protein [Candidatus Nanoarchaeia archaeon]
MYGDRPHFNGGQRSFAPVKPGEVYDVTIEAVGEKGDGIAKIRGFVIFIPGVKQGEQVKIKINKVLRKVAFGEVVNDGTAVTEQPAEGSEGTGESNEASTEESSQETKSEDSEEF